MDRADSLRRRDSQRERMDRQQTHTTLSASTHRNSAQMHAASNATALLSSCNSAGWLGCSAHESSDSEAPLRSALLHDATAESLSSAAANSSQSRRGRAHVLLLSPLRSFVSACQTPPAATRLPASPLRRIAVSHRRQR